MTTARRFQRRQVLVTAGALVWPMVTHAEEAPILRITGPSGPGVALDDTGFAALPQRTLRTRTVWTDGTQEFGGVLLRDLLGLAGTEADLRERNLALKALNDYEITIPARDAWDFGALVARTQNGVPLSRRDKGPLWLVYPRDAEMLLQDQRYDQRWVWQLSEIRIE